MGEELSLAFRSTNLGEEGREGGEANRLSSLKVKYSSNTEHFTRERCKMAREDGGVKQRWFRSTTAIPYLYLPSNILRRRLGNGEGGRRERERVESRFYWFSGETGLSTFLCPAEIHRERARKCLSKIPTFPPPPPYFPLSPSSPPSIPVFVIHHHSS